MWNYDDELAANKKAKTMAQEYLKTQGISWGQFFALQRACRTRVRQFAKSTSGLELSKTFNIEELWRYRDESVAKSVCDKYAEQFELARTDDETWNLIFKHECKRKFYKGYPEVRITVELLTEYLDENYILEKDFGCPTSQKVLKDLRTFWFDEYEKFDGLLSRIVDRMTYKVPLEVTWDQDRNLIRGWMDYNKYGH
jgi:hypothetical protein